MSPSSLQAAGPSSAGQGQPRDTPGMGEVIKHLLCARHHFGSEQTKTPTLVEPAILSRDRGAHGVRQLTGRAPGNGRCCGGRPGAGGMLAAGRRGPGLSEAARVERTENTFIAKTCSL